MIREFIRHFFMLVVLDNGGFAIDHELGHEYLHTY